MSTLQSERTESKAEFLDNSLEIYRRTINFLSYMSARYSRLISAPIAALAVELTSECEKANAIFPNNDLTVELRKRHTVEARATLNALDVQLTLCYEVLRENPAGAFTKRDGTPVKSETAKSKLSHAAQSIGNLINEEKRLLDGQMKMLTK